MNRSRRSPSRSSSPERSQSKPKLSSSQAALVGDRDVGRARPGLARDRVQQEPEQHDDDADRDQRTARQVPIASISAARSRSRLVSPCAECVVSATFTVTPTHVDVGVMIGALGEEADPHDERDRRREGPAVERLDDLVALADPAGERHEGSRDLGVGEGRHRLHSTRAAPTRHTRGVPGIPDIPEAPSPLEVELDRAVGLRLAWPDGTSDSSVSKSSGSTAPAPAAAAAGSRDSTPGRRPVRRSPCAPRAPSSSAPGACRSTGTTATRPASTPGACSKAWRS